jgi:hypothetical protein
MEKYAEVLKKEVPHIRTLGAIKKQNGQQFTTIHWSSGGYISAANRCASAKKTIWIEKLNFTIL